MAVRAPEESEASRAGRPEPVAARSPFSFAAPASESPARRLLFIIGCFVVVVMAGAGGYRWYSRSTLERRPAAVDATEESLTSPSGGPQPTRPTDRPEQASTPRGVEVSNIIAEFTKETTDAGNALGAPDGRIASVGPGGSLAAAWTDGPFYNGHGPDVRVHGPLGHRAPYLIFARSGPDDAWERFDVNQKGFSDGTASHDLGHHGIARAQQIMVRNTGTSPLYLDAITPLHRQPESPEEHPASHPPK